MIKRKPHRDEFPPDPGLVPHGIHHLLALHSGVGNVRELRGGVVAPDDDVLHLCDGHGEAACDLGLGGTNTNIYKKKVKEKNNFEKKID